jgi:hypothetical protein
VLCIGIDNFAEPLANWLTATDFVTAAFTRTPTLKLVREVAVVKP